MDPNLPTSGQPIEPASDPLAPNQPQQTMSQPAVPTPQAMMPNPEVPQSSPSPVTVSAQTYAMPVAEMPAVPATPAMPTTPMPVSTPEVAMSTPTPVTIAAPVYTPAETYPQQQFQSVQTMPITQAPVLNKSKHYKILYRLGIALSVINLGALAYVMTNDDYVVKMGLAIGMIVALIIMLAASIAMAIVKSPGLRKKAVFLVGLALVGVAGIGILAKANAGLLFFLMIYSLGKVVQEERAGNNA